MDMWERHDQFHKNTEKMINRTWWLTAIILGAILLCIAGGIVLGTMALSKL